MPIRNTLLLFVCLLFVCCPFSSIRAQQSDERLKGIEHDLHAILEATKAPGFSVAIVEGSKVIYAQGFGYRDYDHKIPADAHTLYAVGSTTKAFTSAILGQLREEGKLSFEDSPLKYVSGLRFYNDEMNNHIIIKDLLSHRTGLPRHDLSWYLFPTDSKDSLVLRIAHQEPFTGVRKQWYYNNFMFLLQGVIAERITGKTWEDNIRDRFFKPLGMNRSNVSISELEQNGNAALGYELKDDSIIRKMDYYHIAAMGPAGSINSSAVDMSHWLVTWINKGKSGDQEILSKTYVDEAISSQMVVSGALPDPELPDLHFANYGYGWFLSSYKGNYMVQHGGNIDGFSANVAFFPSDSIGIVVLTNQNASAVPTLVRNTIADRILKTSKTDWAKRFTETKEKARKAAEAAEAAGKDSVKIAGTKPAHRLQDYTGSYSHPGYGTFGIRMQQDSLFVQLPLKTYYLRHLHYDVFELFEVTKNGIDTSVDSSFRINFNTNEEGKITAAHMKVEGALDHTTAFLRKPEEK